MNFEIIRYFIYAKMTLKEFQLTWAEHGILKNLRSISAAAEFAS
jgi:hypothetical protein